MASPMPTSRSGQSATEATPASVHPPNYSVPVDATKRLRRP